MSGGARRREGLLRLGLSLVVPLAFLIAGVAARDTVPETWDEQFDQDIGRFYLSDWPSQGPAGLERRFIPLQRNYGPAFDVVVVGVHRLLHDRLGWVTNPVASHHMATLACSALGLWLVFWIGARLFRPGVGLAASATLALMPQFVAHSHNNLKDTPLAVAFTAAVLVLFQAVRRDHGGEFNGLECVEQFADGVFLVARSNVPEIEMLVFESRGETVLWREDPEPLEPPVFGRLEVAQVFVGERGAPPEVSDFPLNEPRGRTRSRT